MVKIVAKNKSCENSVIHLLYAYSPLLAPSRTPDDKLVEVTVRQIKFDGVEAMVFYFRDISESLRDENLGDAEIQ